jgi:ectoine hydroxylase-related dioxygenase (phytanoyl-CoA dioxygenase family)
MTYDLANYEQTGIATPIRVIDEAEASALYKRVIAVEESGDDDSKLALHTSPHLLFPWLYDLATRPAVLDAVEQVLGPDLLIWSSQFFMKNPGDGGFVSWHQDATYWGLEPNTIATAWIALTPSVPESGCMRVAPGSHNQSLLPHTDTFDEGNLLSRGQEITVDISGMDIIDVTLQPGEMSLHHVELVHGSEPNTSTWPRIGYVVRFIPTSVRQIGGRTRAVLVRGQDRHNHFELTDPPDGELTEEGWATVKDAQARMTAILMDSADQESQHSSHQLSPKPSTDS